MINHKNTQRNCRVSNAKRRKTAILEERATRRERGMWNCTDRAGDVRLFAPYRSPSHVPYPNPFLHFLNRNSKIQPSPYRFIFSSLPFFVSFLTDYGVTQRLQKDRIYTTDSTYFSRQFLLFIQVHAILSR